MRHVLLALLAALAGVTHQVPAQDAEHIARRASSVYRALSSLRADFHQIIEDRMIGTQESRGELVQAGTANLAMRFSDPRGDAIVLDGTHAWIYTPSTTPGQVIRMAIPTDPVYGPNVIARILDRPAERYAIRWLRADEAESRPVDVIEFIPHSPDPLFSRAVIWIDRPSALPRRLELDELTGMRRTLVLSRVRINTPVAQREFSFDVPSGVRVVQR